MTALCPLLSRALDSDFVVFFAKRQQIWKRNLGITDAAFATCGGTAKG